MCKCIAGKPLCLVFTIEPFECLEGESHLGAGLGNITVYSFARLLSQPRMLRIRIACLTEYKVAFHRSGYFNSE